jgi:hypothetical protein
VGGRTDKYIDSTARERRIQQESPTRPSRLQTSLKPIGHSLPYLVCRIGQSCHIRWPRTGSSFQQCPIGSGSAGDASGACLVIVELDVGGLGAGDNRAASGDDLLRDLRKGDVLVLRHHRQRRDKLVKRDAAGALQVGTRLHLTPGLSVGLSVWGSACRASIAWFLLGT